MARESKSSKRASVRSAGRSGSSSQVLILIGLFKLLKALLLIVIGIGALRLLRGEAAETAMHWARVLRVDPDNRYVHGALSRVFRVTPKQLAELSVGTFIYAGLFATEGIGLLTRRRWAEYFTVVTTGLLIPLEIYELNRHFTPIKLIVLLINVLIVWYLAARLRSR